MSRSVLLTAAVEDTELFREQVQHENLSLLHTPLEWYRAVSDDRPVLDIVEELDRFENIVHGSKRNARFFIEKVSEAGRLDQARRQLNLAVDQPAADYLESKGIPAIHPQVQGRAINLLEFMLRVRRMGETLYPCGDKTKEDLPGLLQELEMPVQELVLFTLEGPEEEALAQYQKQVLTEEPDIVIFHSRRSVNRTLAAYPDLNYDEATIITGDQAVTDKLVKEEIDTDRQAGGSWKSIQEHIL
ncbi:MAG TPA: uroporphyrinogen-III synthase [Fodinibius sp.]|nr:uroporphyrinogen-III synthase [Fodinibius sp.]